MNVKTAALVILAGVAVVYLLTRQRAASNPFTYSVTARKTVAADLSGVGGFHPTAKTTKDKTATSSCGCLL